MCLYGERSFQDRILIEIQYGIVGRSSGLKGYGELGLTCAGLRCTDSLSGRSFVNPTSHTSSSFLPYLHTRSSSPSHAFFKGI